MQKDNIIIITNLSDEAYKQGCAPSVLILFINMMLFGHSTPEAGCKEFMFEGQGTIQRVFVLVGLCCIPVMLLGKPLYLLAAGKKKNKAKVPLSVLLGDVSGPSLSQTPTVCTCQKEVAYVVRLRIFLWANSCIVHCAFVS